MIRNVKSQLLVLAISLLLGACATDGTSPDQLIPDESRATPELELLNQQAKLADVGGDAAKAEALYKAVLRKVPNDTETWYRLGNLYANHNRPAEAATAYERTIISDNSHTKAWHNLAVIRLRQSYASLLQSQLLVDPADPLSQRIDEMIEQLGKVTALDGEAQQAAKVPRPKLEAPNVSPAAESVQGATPTTEVQKP